MPDVTVERRNTARHPLVLATEVAQLPGGARLLARTSDISRGGCYVDTLNTLEQETKVRVRFHRGEETLELLADVVYVSPRLGMGLKFVEVPLADQAKLDRWLEESPKEF